MRKTLRRLVTLREVVETVQDVATTDEEVVAVLAHLLGTRRVRRILHPPAKAA